MEQQFDALFSLVCGQNREHTWIPGGLPLPLCQRCTGLYVGVAVGSALRGLLRFRSTARFRWIHGLFLLQMGVFGFHLVPQGPLLRGVSGYLFGLGMATFLGALAFDRGETVAPGSGRVLLVYGAGAFAGLSFLPLAEGGGPVAGDVLSLVSLAGLASAAALLLWSLGIVARTLFGRVAPPHGRSVP
jgi:uncharacterized membrane protein